jgi:hypothetical protein
MKYLNKYTDFKEAMEISSTDQPDEKLAKEKVNTTEENLKEYKEKKPKIEQLYSTTKNPVEIEEELKKLMPEKEEPNPFLTDYLRICRIQKEIEDGRSSDVEDKKKIDDFQQQQKLASDKGEVSSIGSKITEIIDRVKSFATILNQKSQELKKLMTDHKDKMMKIEQDIKSDIKKIQTK